MLQISTLKIRKASPLLIALALALGLTMLMGIVRARANTDITIEKYTNGIDADTPEEGPVIPVGDPVVWTYVVTNTSAGPGRELYDIVVVDDRGVSVSCPSNFLGVGESMTCYGYGTAEAGQYQNCGTVTGNDRRGTVVNATDCSHYFGEQQEEPPTNPGTGTIGYWRNHPEAWPVESITIGGVSYSKANAIAIFATPGRGDKTYDMFPQLVAAKLNVLIGNDDSCIASTIAAADAWMSANPLGSNVRASSAAWGTGGPLHSTLDAYNNGYLCAPHRD